MHRRTERVASGCPALVRTWLRKPHHGRNGIKTPSCVSDDRLMGAPISINPAEVLSVGFTLQAIRASSWPVIAAVDGYAAGIGCDFALTCDLRLITERARFAELFARVGLIPDGGGTYLLPRLVGLGRAMELMFTGRDVLAEEALQIGLANHVFAIENFAAEVQAYAAVLASQSPHALKRGKAAMLAALDSSYTESLDREATYQREIFAQPDGTEGFQAFIEKRSPVWK